MSKKTTSSFLHFALSLYIPGFFINLGYGIISPILPLYAQSFGITIVLVALITTSSALGGLCTGMPLGFLCDRVGRRPFSIIGPLLVIISAILSGLAQSFYELLAYNFLMGVGIAIWMITGMAMIADNVNPSMRGKVTTTYQAVNMIGTMIGPVIGGLISQLTNSYRACFFIFAASASVSMVAAMILVRESAPSQRQESSFPIKDNLRKLLSLLSFPILMATFMVFTSHIRYAAWGTFLPLYGGDILRLSVGEIGLIMSISTFTNLLTYSPAGYIIDKYGRKVALIPSFIITAFSFIAMPLVNNFVGIVLVAALLGIASGLSSATWALAADLSPEDMRGFFVGFWHTFGDVGMMIGPIILGLIADSYGYALSFYTVAGLMFLTAATSQLFVKETLKRVE